MPLPLLRLLLLVLGLMACAAPVRPPSAHPRWAAGERPRFEDLLALCRAPDPAARGAVATVLNDPDNIAWVAGVLALTADGTAASRNLVATQAARATMPMTQIVGYARHWDLPPELAARCLAEHPPTSSATGLTLTLHLTPSAAGVVDVGLELRNDSPEPRRLPGHLGVYLAGSLIAVSSDGQVSSGQLTALYRLGLEQLDLAPGASATATRPHRLGPLGDGAQEEAQAPPRWRAQLALVGNDAYLPLRGRGPWSLRALRSLGSQGVLVSPPVTLAAQP